jgi:hypothetical protein
MRNLIIYALHNIITVEGDTNKDKPGSKISRHWRDVNRESVPLRNYDLSMGNLILTFERKALYSYSSIHSIWTKTIPLLKMRSLRSLEKSVSDYMASYPTMMKPSPAQLRKYLTAFSGPGPPHYRGLTMTLRHTNLSRTPLDE